MDLTVRRSELQVKVRLIENIAFKDASVIEFDGSSPKISLNSAANGSQGMNIGHEICHF